MPLEADGHALETAAVNRWLTRFDPSLAATNEELGLASVNWENCARAGHFGPGVAWENDLRLCEWSEISKVIES